MSAAPVHAIGLSPERLAERKTGLGGSDAAAACGLDPFRSQLQVYLEKRGETPEPDLSENQAVKFGTRLEDVIADEYMERTGRRVQRVNAMLRSKSHPFMIANLDRRVVGERRILECKTAGYWAARKSEDWGEEGTDVVPIRYFLQVQHYLHVAELDVADLAVLIAGQDLRIYKIPRDDAAIAKMIEREAEMWQRIQDGNPPAPRSADDAALQFPVSIDRSIIATQEIAELVGDLQFQKKKLAAITEGIEQIKARVMAFMGDADTLTFAGDPIVTWKSRDVTRIDTKALKKEAPELHERYARTSSSRYFIPVEAD